VLVDRYDKKLSRYIFRISGFDKQTIEDLLQEIFTKVYQNLNDFDDDFSFSSWIYRISHNVTINHVRDLKRRPKLVNIFDEDSDKDLMELLPSDVDMPKQLDREAARENVRQALFELPDKYREVLVLSYLEDKSYREISDILKRSVNSVSVLINRAKTKLKSKLEFLNR
jgi:RNA polymerase sigma-70 factor (ECF subfamily)